MRLASDWQERARQPVHAAVDAHHVDVAAAHLLPQQLEERRVHQRLLVHQEPEELDRRLGPALLLQELARRVVVVPVDDLRPAVVALRGDAVGERPDRALPHRLAGQAALVLGKVGADQVGFRVDLAEAVLAAEQVAPRVRIVHREVGGRKAELVDVGQRQPVRARDAHRADLGVQAGRERLAHRVHPSAHALLRLEHHRIVARAQQLVCRDQPGHAGADDDHALARAPGGRQAVVDDPQVVVLGGHGLGRERNSHARQTIPDARTRGNAAGRPPPAAAHAAAPSRPVEMLTEIKRAGTGALRRRRTAVASARISSATMPAWPAPHPSRSPCPIRSPFGIPNT